MNELDPDFFEAELRKLNPAPPPENFMARLSDALPAARPSARPLPKQGVRGTRWSLTLPHLLRWAAPAAITGVLLVVLAIRQSSAPATKSNPGTPPDPMGTVVNADDVEIDQQLVATFPTWEDVRDAPTNSVAETIRTGGLANIKAVRIQEVLQTLTEQQQAEGSAKTLSAFLSDELASHTTEEALRYLRILPGVGPKTAACVLMFHLDRPAFPIDTHVWRTAKRLGLIGPNVSADAAHILFAQVLPPEWVYPLHVNLIRHGRQVCHAQRPQCSVCPLYHECAYVGSVNAQETALSSA